VSLLLRSGVAPTAPNIPWRLQAENRQCVEAESYRRVSDDGWAAFRPFYPVTVVTVPFFVRYPKEVSWNWEQDNTWRVEPRFPFSVAVTPAPAFFIGQPPQRQWVDWPKDEATRERTDLWRMFMPQRSLSPIFGALSNRKQWEDWPLDEAKRERTELWRFYMPQNGLKAWGMQPEARQQFGAEEFRRVSENGWDLYRFFWTQPSVASPFFVGTPPATPWQYWQNFEGRQEDVGPWRFFMPQTTLAPWVHSQAENRQQQGAEEYRKVGDDGWGDFRYYWTPPIGPSFIIYSGVSEPFGVSANNVSGLSRVSMPPTGIGSTSTVSQNKTDGVGEEWYGDSNTDFKP
jgi:hypothetical protein